MLRATTACTFSTSQLPKVLRAPGVLYILTCASRHNGVQFFISHLASWLRTRHFSEPTFRPSGAPNYWKNTVFRDFPTFSRICIFFLLTLLSSNLSLLSASSLLCFSSVHIVGSLTSKLPSMNALERARLSALHCGAFMTNYEHSHCDVEKTPMCEQCSCGDDRAHWSRCPRYQQIRNDIPDWCSDNLQLPPCTLHHLLVHRQRCMVRWRQMLCQPDSAGIVFLVPPTNNKGIIMFFWMALVNKLHGVSQSIDRAELTALLACLRWTMGTELGLCIWSDSHSTIQIAEYVLRYPLIPDGVANLDLWTEEHILLKDRQGIPTDLRWVPSHIPSTAGEDPFEDWIIHWNDAADRLACFTNRTRSSAFWACYRAASSTLDGWAKRVRQLRTFYFKVADYTKPETTPDADHVSIASSHDDRDWLWQITFQSTGGSNASMATPKYLGPSLFR